MHFTWVLGKLMRNLNKPYWDRRVWEQVGFRGTPLGSFGAKQRRRTIYPVEESHRKLLQQRFLIEYNVMRHITRPYLDQETERPYVEKYGDIIDQWNAKEVATRQAKMPGKPKRYNKATGKLEKRRANVGNMLQSHRSIEDSLSELINRERWD